MILDKRKGKNNNFHFLVSNFDSLYYFNLLLNAYFRLFSGLSRMKIIYDFSISPIAYPNIVELRPFFAMSDYKSDYVLSFRNEC